MTITSFIYFSLLFMLLILYYTIFYKHQWICLLIGSLIFYYLSVDFYTIIYLFITTLITYFVSILIKNDENNIFKHKRIVFIFTSFAIVIISLLWFILKWKPLELTFGVKLIAALGMGYYTLQAIGYIIDCYWGSIEPQTNFLKLFLFLIYFPQLTTGPISRYSDLSVIYCNNKFNYNNICHGLQRILYGVIKKLVLAERLNVIVNDLLNGYNEFKVIYSVLLILLYPLLMYSDFSGCMDIALGSSELFGINLKENFNNPFFSRNVQEFWQRWHITLGTWAKDYVMYPILKSEFILKLGERVKYAINKSVAKTVTMAFSLFFLWLVMGFWHGGMQYIVGVSFWYWTIMVISLFLQPLIYFMNKYFVTKSDSFSWHLFQSIRTYIIYAIGAIFFVAGLKGGYSILMKIVTCIAHPAQINIGTSYLFNKLIVANKLQYSEIFNIMIIVFTLLIVLLVGILREKYVYARYWVDMQCICFRWAIWIFLFVFAIIFAKYGPGYNPADFIYKGF